MITLKHRTASGDLSNQWEFDSARSVIEAVITLGSAKPIAFTIRVCAVDKPELWCHPIARLDGESWRILPAMIISAGVGKTEPRDCGHSIGLKAAIPCDLHHVIGPKQIVLTNAPEEIDREIEALSA